MVDHQTTYVPVKKKRRKRISAKKTLYEIFIAMLPDRDPVGLNYQERKFLQQVGKICGKAYSEEFGRTAETDEKTEYWLFGGKNKRKASPFTMKVNLYESAFHFRLKEIIQEEAKRNPKIKLK